MPDYMNVIEIESALRGLAGAYPAFCELIRLLHATAEGRTSYAVRLGTAAANTVDACFLTGNIHANELGSSDILINLAADLCEAYEEGTGLGYGGRYFSAAEVKALMEQINIIIFPCVNPDGRAYSQNHDDEWWRKNRNPAGSDGDPNKIGVDLNRNQDFLWDLDTAFAPEAINSWVASSDPVDGTYHGSAPGSEAETQNINYIHDTYTRIRWYVDLHSYSQDILYVWGDDELQVADLTKNFRNPDFDRQRGILGDEYDEYIPDGDLASLQALAQAFTRSLAEVRGKYYVAKPGFSLYPISGANDSYAYSRHFTNPTLSKTLGFTVEWGTEFQPLWPEMGEIIKDVCAGLMGLGLKALGIDSFIVTNRDTFSSYEVETVKDYDNAFYVIYDGFAPSALGVPGAEPEIRFLSAIGGSSIGSIRAIDNPRVDLEDPGDLTAPQRISFTFGIHFDDTSAFTAEMRNIYVEATLNGITVVALMHLVNQPNPYMVDGPVSWLSTDVRVFQLRPGEKVHSSSGITLEDPDVVTDAPYHYIQGLIAELRGYGNEDAPSFEGLSSNELELSRTVDGVRVLNFAVAKIRYRANTQDAVDVRAFFRTFNTMVSDLSYTRAQYDRTSDGTIPLLGINRILSGGGNQIVSVPYFAERRVDTTTQSMMAQTDNTNKQTLVHAGAVEAHTYFGCWLDFNQNEQQFPVNVPSGSDGPFTDRVPIIQLVRGIHQCLVAEVRFQPGETDPISLGATPASSDHLAQRNLTILESDNPGSESTHRVQHTFLLKPSTSARVGESQALAISANQQARYDELVFRWNDLPRETIASLYLPDWNADEVIALANTLRPGPQILTKVDAHTVSFTVSDIAYIPIPGQICDTMPGLLTLQLPLTVRTGQQFTVDVQQHTGLTFQPPVRGRRRAGTVNFSRRRVLGGFQVSVVVKSGEPLLQKLVRNLAVLRYIFQAIPATDSWHLVFKQYLSQLGDQIAGLGIDPARIPASPDDPWPLGRRQRITGKVREVIFNCFGDLQGFVLESCSDEHFIRSDEKGVAEIVLRACHERCTVTVCLGEHGLQAIIVQS